MALIERLALETATLALHEQVDQVLKASGLIEHFRRDKADRGEARVENLDELVSAARGFTPERSELPPLEAFLAHAALEAGEDPYPEPFDVPPATAALVNHVHARGGLVIAAGTTVVRALETAALGSGSVAPAAGWTSHVVTPETGVRAVDGLLTGLHEPRSSHLRMLAAFADADLLSRCYAAAIDGGYLWHEFGDVHLMLP